MSSAEPIGIAPGFGRENVVGLEEAAKAETHYALLRGLTSGGRTDFTLRFAAVAELVHADQTLWTLDAIERRLCWLDTEHLVSVVRALRKSGWLEPVGTSLRLSNEGLAVYSTLSRLSSLCVGRTDDLALGVFDLEASTRLDEDTGPALRHLQHHLRRAIEDVEAAVKSQSELKVLEAREKLDQNLQWSRRARTLLDAINIDDEVGYRAGQRLGRDLSELHRWQSVMQRALDEVGRTRVPLGASGIRPADISRYLAARTVDELAAIGERCVSRPVWPLVAILDNVLSTAEFELLSEAEERERKIGWSDAPAAAAVVGEPPPSSGELAFAAFTKALDDVIAGGKPVAVERFLLAGDFQKTCYRMTLLALEDEQDRVRIAVEPGPGVKVYTDYLSEISRGTISPVSTESGAAAP